MLRLIHFREIKYLCGRDFLISADAELASFSLTTASGKYFLSPATSTTGQQK